MIGPPHLLVGVGGGRSLGGEVEGAFRAAHGLLADLIHTVCHLKQHAGVAGRHGKPGHGASHLRELSPGAKRWQGTGGIGHRQCNMGVRDCQSGWDALRHQIHSSNTYIM
eukprot:scaffold420596_cov16-Prasinocladus_malaysianus.AAC.1